MIRKLVTLALSCEGDHGDSGAGSIIKIRSLSDLGKRVTNKDGICRFHTTRLNHRETMSSFLKEMSM